MKWTKINKMIKGNGETTITYRLEGTPYTVESRKRPIPHTNRPGTWSFTSYIVLKDGMEIAEKHALGYAKEFAEMMFTEEEH